MTKPLTAAAALTRLLAAALAAASANSTCPTAALAADRSCWIDVPGKPVRPEVTCAALTEAFLRRLERASPAQVVHAMGAPGARSPDGLHYHYMSNYIGKAGRSGDVNITFEGGRAVIVEAYLDPEGDESGPPQFLWNATEGSCSDLRGGQNPCRHSR